MHPSLSFTISNLDMRGLHIYPQSTWLNPNVKELAKAQILYPACRLLIESPKAPKCFSSQGPNHHSLIGDLNSSDPVEMDCPTAERVGGLTLPYIFSRLRKKCPFHKEVKEVKIKFQGAVEKTFKSRARSSQVAL